MSVVVKGSTRTGVRKLARGRMPMQLTMKRVARIEAKKVINKSVETKIFDSNATSQAVDATNGVVSSLTNGMIRGIGEDQYLGDQITPVGAIIRIQYGRADSSNMLRFLLIQNKSGGIPLASTVFASTFNITAPLSPYDVDYQDTYRVLYDKLVSMDSVRCTTGVLTIRLRSKQLRKLSFNDAAGTIEKAGIYLVVISDSTTVTHPVIDWRARLYYKDA